MLRSVHARLLIGFGIVIVMTLVLSGSAVTLLLREQEARAAEARIGLLVGPITEGARQRELMGWPTDLIRAELTAVARTYDLRVFVLDRSGRVVIDTEDGQPMLGEVLDLSFTGPVTRQGAPAFRTQRLNLRGEDLYLFAAQPSTGVGMRNQESQQQVLVAVPTEDVAGAWARLLPRLSLAGVGAGVVAVIFALLFASRFTTPIAQMTRASRAMARGDLDQRIDVSGADEVGELAEAFNLMSSRVSRSDQSMRDLLANVSHELRTPLTSIQGFSQAVVDGVAGDPREAAGLIHEEAERIRLLLDELLYLSEIESGTMSLDREPVEVDDLVDGTLRRFRMQAEERGVELVGIRGGGAINADGRRLEQVLANLVDNAIRFAPVGTPVTIKSSQVADGVLIEVHNGGEPIPSDDLRRVFDRFYQVDRARAPGRHRGLGLAIVQELVQAHGGQVSVESSADAGTTFSVFLPLGPSEGASAPSA